jgi:hypothetical protein
MPLSGQPNVARQIGPQMKGGFAQNLFKSICVIRHPSTPLISGESFMKPSTDGVPAMQLRPREAKSTKQATT